MLASRHADTDRFVALRHDIQPPVRRGTLFGTFASCCLIHDNIVPAVPFSRHSRRELLILASPAASGSAPEANVRKDDSGRSGYDGRLEVAASRPGISECEQAAEVQPTTKDVLEAREILESVLDNSTQYSLIGKDLDRRITVWNKGAARIYGYEASEVIGRSSDILHVPEEIRSGVIEELHQRAQAEGLAAGLFRRRRKDGSEFLARLTVTTRKDAQGNAKGYFVFSHDVTAEQRYVEEQRFLARVGETLQISLDYATTIEGIARLTIGFLGDGCAIDVLEEAGKLDRKKVVHADAAKAGLAEALQHILPERGHPIWKVLETKQPLLFSEVSADLLRSIANDDEHLRLLEAIGIESVMLVPLVARDRLLAVLSTVWCRPGFRYRPEDVGVAQEFARRAALALDNALLYDLAQTAIRTREQILGFVAHDLRNPLGTIVSSAALLRRLSADAGGSRRPVDAIERAAIRMKRLIQDLLDVARMEGGFLPIEPGVVETRQAIADCIDAHQDLAASAFLALESDVSADVPDVWADRDRLLQVFENLIGNAVKFTGQSGSIVIGARSQDRGVQFWVRDSGMGIAEEDLPQLFDRFWQADNVRRRGTGLGLPIVKGIVEAHGGRIWVESVKGRGSTFFFTIPTAAHASANLP